MWAMITVEVLQGNNQGLDQDREKDSSRPKRKRLGVIQSAQCLLIFALVPSHAEPYSTPANPYSIYHTPPPPELFGSPA